MPNKFNTGDPLAYFLTWTTYGTWLPGDERGWNRKGEFESQEPNYARNESATAELKETPFILSDTDRETVESTVSKHCQIRKWELHAVNVRSNHVHAVVTAQNYQPDVVVSQFKAWCTRNLRSIHLDRERFWTQGASKRWINQESELAAAIEYTLEAQDCKGIEYERFVSGWKKPLVCASCSYDHMLYNTSPTRQRVVLQIEITAVLVRIFGKRHAQNLSLALRARIDSSGTGH